MKISRNRLRMIFSALVIAAFFVPAYGKMSAFNFILLSIETVKAEAEITFVDLLAFLLPLLFIPFAAFVILMRAARRKQVSSYLLLMPLLFLSFFILILSFTLNRESDTLQIFSLLKQMSTGFYLAAFSSLLLLLSYSRNESLNFSGKTR